MFFLITLVSFLINLSFNISSYIPRILRDEYYYTEARILSLNAKELAKYFLYKAKQEGKECINFINFNYPKDDDIVRIDYFILLQSVIILNLKVLIKMLIYQKMELLS